VTVFWSATALGHLTAIRNYIALNSLSYADAMIRRIIQRAEQLQHAPMMGAVVPQYADNAVREVLERPYRIIYRVGSDGVDVLAVVHGAQRLPRSLSK
jgi:plasmid stabilization system protein ParE